MSYVPAAARTWYVDSALGNDSNIGTAPSSAFATLQKGHDATSAGDTVYVMPGNGYGGGSSGVAPLIISHSGSAGKPITFSGFPGLAKPVISGTQAKGAILGSNPLSYIVVNGFELAGWQNSLTWAAVCANSGSGSPTASNVYNGYGVSIAGSTSGQTVHHITVSNCSVHDFPGNGIGINLGDYLTVTGNTVSSCCFYSPLQSSGISLYALHNIDAGTGTKNVVRGNTVYNCIVYVPNPTIIATTQTTTGSNSLGTTDIANVPVTSALNFSMTIIDVTQGAVPAGATVNFFNAHDFGSTLATTAIMPSGTVLQIGYITDGEGIIIDNNTNTQTDNIPYVGRTLVTDNLVFNCGSAGIAITPGTNNVDVTFNTCYLNQRGNGTSFAGEVADLGTNGSNVYNNICFALSSAPSGWSQATGTTTWSNNAFFGGNAAHTLPGSSNVITDPLFSNASTDPKVANFYVQASSPVIGAGSATFTRAVDIAGHTGQVGASYDIGAYEYNVALSPAAPVQTIGSNRGDTSQTLIWGVDSPTQLWGTTLTGNRTITLSTTNATNGNVFRIVRTGLGSFTLAVGSAKTIPSATAAFVDVTFNGTAWVETGYGTL